MHVSIVIPAYNAAETITEALVSLQTQTYLIWEAIVVNDGSDDETAAVVHQIAAEDTRIRLVSQTNQGVSAARNTGIHHARFDWIGFLDADDWFSPQYLEKMTAALTADPSIDVVHCGIRSVDTNGRHGADRFTPDKTDLFSVFACRCPLLVQACVLRKQIAEAVGGFDTELKTAEDWDFLQRIARVGAHFGAVKDVLVFYRMRPHSLSRGESIFADALQVIDRGHRPDPRVRAPAPRHVTGQPREALPQLKFHLSAWYAGFWLGRGEDGRHLLKLLSNDRAPNLSPDTIAYRIFLSITVTVCQYTPHWEQLWPALEDCVKDFLLALEAQAQSVGLARRTLIILERMIVQNSTSLAHLHE